MFTDDEQFFGIETEVCYFHGVSYPANEVCPLCYEEERIGAEIDDGTLLHLEEDDCHGSAPHCCCDLHYWDPAVDDIAANDKLDNRGLD